MLQLPVGFGGGHCGSPWGSEMDTAAPLGACLVCSAGLGTRVWEEEEEEGRGQPSPSWVSSIIREGAGAGVQPHNLLPPQHPARGRGCPSHELWLLARGPPVGTRGPIRHGGCTLLKRSRR